MNLNKTEIEISSRYRGKVFLNVSTCTSRNSFRRLEKLTGLPLEQVPLDLVQAFLGDVVFDGFVGVRLSYWANLIDALFGMRGRLSLTEWYIRILAPPSAEK